LLFCEQNISFKIKRCQKNTRFILHEICDYWGGGVELVQPAISVGLWFKGMSRRVWGKSRETSVKLAVPRPGGVIQNLSRTWMGEILTSRISLSDEMLSCVQWSQKFLIRYRYTSRSVISLRMWQTKSGLSSAFTEVMMRTTFWYGNPKGRDHS